MDARIDSGQIREIDRIAVRDLGAHDAGADADLLPECDSFLESYDAPSLMPSKVRFSVKPEWRRPEVFTIDAGTLVEPEADEAEATPRDVQEAESREESGEDGIPEPDCVIAPQNSIARLMGDLPYTNAGAEGRPQSGPVLDCGFNALIMNIPRLQDACRRDAQGAHSTAVLDELAQRVRHHAQSQSGTSAVTAGGLSNFLFQQILTEERIRTKLIDRRDPDCGAMLEASRQAGEHLLLHTDGNNGVSFPDGPDIAGHHYVTLVPVPGGWRLYDPLHPRSRTVVTRQQILALGHPPGFALYAISKPGQRSAVGQWPRAREQTRRDADARIAGQVTAMSNGPPGTVTSPVLAYYLHPQTAPAGSGDMAVSLDVHRGQTAARLESNHRYIQRMFPTDEKSAVWPEAPTLTADDIAAFCADAGLRGELVKSLKTMLAFYHLELDESGEKMRIKPEDGFDPDTVGWMGTTTSKFNHNYQRITRILCSLRLLG